MKKIFYTMGVATAILFTSCAEDKGTSFEVADANEDERVKPSHIRNYYMPGTAGSTTATTDDKAITSQTTADTGAQQQQLSAVELVTAYYNNNRPEDSYRWQNYRFSSTQRMGGRTTDTRTTQSADTANKQITTMAPGSTTADAQGRDATTGVNTSSPEKKSTLKDKKSTTKDQKKTRLTPEQ